jgi:hypothetical protein
MYRQVIPLLLCGVAFAHEMTPTYPVFSPSYVEGVHKAEMSLFNKRTDVEYYEVGVFDKDWKPIRFVSAYQFVKVPYLSSLKFDVFVKDGDLKRVEYICSKSVLRRTNFTEPVVSSKICSKVKQ